VRGGYSGGAGEGTELAGFYQSLDAFGGDVRVFVFPDSNHSPAKLDEFHVRVAIPALIRHDLFLPERRIRLGRSSMLRATMPETTIYEDGDLRSEKNDVGPAIHAWNEALLEPIAKAPTEQSRSQLQLSIRVTLACRPHSVSRLNRRSPGRFLGNWTRDFQTPERTADRGDESFGRNGKSGPVLARASRSQ